ncbi:glycosyltransferase, partial [Enterococcus hirae]|nr:glycosyltransferase [Enterococcus hirae]
QSDIDCVGTRRSTRDGEPPIRSFFAKKFYQLINKISDTEMVDAARDFRLMTRQMVDAILELTEYNRFSKGLFSWVGFKTKYISFE